MLRCVSATFFFVLCFFVGGKFVCVCAVCVREREGEREGGGEGERDGKWLG